MSIPALPFKYKTSFAALVASVSLLSVGLLSGCGLSSDGAASTPIAAIKGNVHGGQSPIQGSTVNLYVTKATATGYGQAGNFISSATSDVNGAFVMPVSASPSNCPAGQQAYITAAGGYPSGSPALANTSILMMVALGDCSTISASTNVIINEVTTVAAAYALSGFMTTANSRSIFAASVSAPAANNAATGSTTAAAGLAHAFVNANNLVDYSAGVARTQTANISVAGVTVNGSVPTVEINTLGDIMQSCVDGVTGNASCLSLFGFTPSISGVAPTNTLQAFINLARNPYPSAAAMNATTGLLGLATATSAFQPNLTAVPPDWSLTVVYLGPSANPLAAPFYLTLDANDTAYYSLANNTGIVGLSAYGTATPAYTAGSVSTVSRGIAADALGNIWVASYTGSAVYEYSATAGGAPTSYSVAASPYGIAVDKANNVWVSSAVLGGTNIQELVQSSSYSVGYTATAPGGFQPYGLTVDANQNIWIAPNFNGSTIGAVLPNLSVGTASAPSYAATGAVATPVSATLNGTFPKPIGIVMDATGNAWFGITGFNTTVTAGVEEVVPSSFTAPITAITPGALVANATLGAKGSQMLGIDGAGSLYLADAQGGGTQGIHVYSTTTASTSTTSNVLSPSIGYLGCYLPTATTTTCANAVYNARQIAIDSTGSVWSGLTSGGFAQMIGLGSPTWPLLSTAKWGLSPGSTAVTPLP